MDKSVIVVHFIELLRGKIEAYVKGGKVEGVTKSDLKDLMDGVVAIAKDKGGKATIAAATLATDGEKTLVALTFNTEQAKKAVEAIESHRLELEATTQADHQRALMVFKRSDIGDVEIGKRSGERVIINSISKRDLPLIYASPLAEQRIKHEIKESDSNIFKIGFVVDANAELRNGNPIAYRVTNVHQIIDLPED